MNSSNYRTTEYNKPFILNRADPYIYKHIDGSYYFTASVPEYDRIILRRAASLEGLKDAEEAVVWRKHEVGRMSAHIWAPELHYLEGKWYLYFAAGEIEDLWRIRPYVLECSGSNPLEDEWLERGMMQAAEEFSFQNFSLDMTIFTHREKHYCVWAEKVGVGKMISNLYIAALESPLKLGTKQVLLTSPDYDWERVGFWVNEGPAVLCHEDKLYLTYSASETGECYCIGMLSIHETGELLDPQAWHKERYPVLCSDPGKGIFGPGHNSFTKAEEDGEDIMIYHARQYDEILGDPLYDGNRHTYRMKVKWDHRGRPVFDFRNQMDQERN